MKLTLLPGAAGKLRAKMVKSVVVAGVTYYDTGSTICGATHVKGMDVWAIYKSQLHQEVIVHPSGLVYSRSGAEQLN